MGGTPPFGVRPGVCPAGEALMLEVKEDYRAEALYEPVTVGEESSEVSGKLRVSEYTTSEGGMFRVVV